MIVSILNEKGGCGKTTIAINLAHAMQVMNNGKILLIDADIQATARDWHEASRGEILNVVGLDRSTLDKDIKAVAYDYSWIFVDGPPRLNKITISALKCSDVVLIPVQPSPNDTWAVDGFVDLVADRISATDGKLKAAFVVSREVKNTTIGKEIRDLLKEYKESHGISTFDAGTSSLVVYATSLAEGKTVLNSSSKGAKKEIESIADELRALIT